MLQITTGKNGLRELVDVQLKFFNATHSIEKYLDDALERVDVCFSKINNKYFQNGGSTTFNPFQSAQYGEFLYYLSNKAYHCGDIEIAEKTYYLNKMLNGVDWFYEVELPDIFFADHPMGSVLGRAKYSNYLSVGKNVTVGNNKGIYPSIGENVIIHQNAFICGKCNIGNNVEISVNAFIKDTDIPSNSLVFGASPNLIIKTYPEREIRKRFNLFIRLFLFL